jgi:hypothetical protein
MKYFYFIFLIGFSFYLFQKDSNKTSLPDAQVSIKTNEIIESNVDVLLTVKEAYDWIPHDQTTFDLMKSTLPKEDQEYYQKFFSLIDQAVVIRVFYLRQLRVGKKISDNFELYENLLKEFSQLASNKYPAWKDVHEAIKEQYTYFKEWNAAGLDYRQKIGIDSDVSPLISSSSQKLHNAYGTLMAMHSNEGEHNKKSFFNHLCALDFI